MATGTYGGTDPINWEDLSENAADNRTALGLGDAATKNTGTSAGTVAAGDHAHAGVYQSENFAINNQIGTSYTLVAGDGISTLVRCNNAAAITLTVPANASVSIAVGASIPIRQVGAGAITLTAAGGVTLNAPAGGTLVTDGQGAQVQLVKVATDEWDVIGQTVAA